MATLVIKQFDSLKGNVTNDQDETIRKLLEYLENANLPIPEGIADMKYGRKNNM